MRLATRQLVLLAVTTVLVLVGCSDEPEAPVPAPDATAYAAALVPFLPVADPENRPSVFVAPVDEPLSLEEQVAVIETVGDGYDLTFVDDRAAAIDGDADGRPVRNEGVLLVLGRIPAEPPYAVRVEAYRNEQDVTASLVTLVWRTDHWSAATEESVDPEAVILDE